MFLSELELDAGLVSHMPCSLVCCLLQGYLAIDARIANETRVETDLEDVLDCGGQEHFTVVLRK